MAAGVPSLGGTPGSGIRSTISYLDIERNERTVAVTGLDHVQVAIPKGGEPAARAFYGELLEMTEVAKPAALAGRGGCWFVSGTAVIHLGVEEPFAPARKAHPAFLVYDLNVLESHLSTRGLECIRADNEIPGITQFHTFDPFGNRIEFQQG